MRIRSLLVAVTAALSAGLVAPSAHAGEIITIAGVQYEVMAEGNVPVNGSTVYAGLPRDLANIDDGGGSSGCVNWWASVSPQSLSWQAVLNLTTRKLHYLWHATGQVGSGYCANSHKITMRITDTPVAGSGIPQSGDQTTATAAAHASHYGYVSGIADANVIYYQTSSATIADRSQVMGSVQVRVIGQYRDYQTGQWKDLGCTDYDLFFTPTPTGPYTYGSAYTRC